MTVVYAVYLFRAYDRDKVGNGNGNNDSGSGAGDGGIVCGGVCCIFYFALVIEIMPVTAMETMIVVVVLVIVVMVAVAYTTSFIFFL